MFWDSSALVPCLVPEPRSRVLLTLLGSDTEAVLWWASPLECQSALYRRHRDGGLPQGLLDAALARLLGLVEDADVVAPADPVRERAARLLAAHPLRAGDALQLAAALTWCGEAPAGEAVVCLDDRLREAARREGFTIRPD